MTKMKRTYIQYLLVLLFFIPLLSIAQNKFIGTWEIVSTTKQGVVRENMNRYLKFFKDGTLMGGDLERVVSETIYPEGETPGINNPVLPEKIILGKKRIIREPNYNGTWNFNKKNKTVKIQFDRGEKDGDLFQISKLTRRKLVIKQEGLIVHLKKME